MTLTDRLNKLKSVLGLSLSLARANFKLRNEGSYLGILWYLLYPLALFAIILFIKGMAFSNVRIEFYPLYLIFGIVMTNFFTQTIAGSIDLINANSGFIKSMKIPYEALVISRVLQSVFSHVFEVIIIFILMIYFKVSVFYLLFYIPIFCIFLIFIIGLSFIFATLGVYIQDLGNIWAVLSQLIFFITPTFYLLDKANPHYTVNLFNPVFYFLTIARQVIVYQKVPEFWMVGISILISFTFLFIGILIFKKFKSKFAELV